MMIFLFKIILGYNFQYISGPYIGYTSVSIETCLNQSELIFMSAYLLNLAEVKELEYLVENTSFDGI